MAIFVFASARVLKYDGNLDTVAALKQAISDDLGLHVEDQRLSHFSGYPLADTIDSLQAQFAGSEPIQLKLSVRQRGGKGGLGTLIRDGKFEGDQSMNESRDRETGHRVSAINLAKQIADAITNEATTSEAEKNKESTNSRSKRDKGKRQHNGEETKASSVGKDASKRRKSEQKQQKKSTKTTSNKSPAESYEQKRERLERNEDLITAIKSATKSQSTVTTATTATTASKPAVVNLSRWNVDDSSSSSSDDE
ncbi:hypothetical protein GQ42DRAFT_161449 [Ramicandelaber brevisporus]|nr:hypothetical protein GQ42DRAFT_161449 [Ramicandelaber brevisporus]